MSRDLYAEWEADRARRELEALRELRDGVLALSWVLGKSKRGERLEEVEKQALILAFDSAGMGPFVVASPEALTGLIDLAKKSKEVEP